MNSSSAALGTRTRRPIRIERTVLDAMSSFIFVSPIRSTRAASMTENTTASSASCIRLPPFATDGEVSLGRHEQARERGGNRVATLWWNSAAMDKPRRLVEFPRLNLHLVPKDGYEWLLLDQLAHRLSMSAEVCQSYSQRIIDAEFRGNVGPFLTAPSRKGLRAIGPFDAGTMYDEFVAIRDRDGMGAFANKYGMPIQARSPLLPGILAIPWSYLNRVLWQVKEARRFINPGENFDQLIRRGEDTGEWQFSSEHAEHGSPIWTTLPDDSLPCLRDDTYSYQAQAIARHIAIWAISDLLRDHVVLSFSIPDGALAPLMSHDADPVGMMALEMVKLLAPDGSHAICQDPRCLTRFRKEHALDQYCCEDHQERARRNRRNARRRHQRAIERHRTGTEAGDPE